MNRREFFKASGSALCATGLLRVLCAPKLFAAGARKQPNILFIMTDQQIADGMSCAGNPYVKTPGMDRVAENGVLFRQAYVTQPLCQPCRTSIQTGRYPHETGVVTNKVDVKKSFPMLGRTLADAGHVVEPEDVLEQLDATAPTHPVHQKLLFRNVYQPVTEAEHRFNHALVAGMLIVRPQDGQHQRVRP
ncbi:MAG: sulfatase-like hydrolase/transferase [Candidatus Krumholzibacteria bacterium]|nr:sulfatase-like hydrolase/transferase [Candidatus Krumholzibacteria bacterium]